MISYKKKAQTSLLLGLLIICTISMNFFYNIADLFLHDFDDRIKNRYGHCSNESIGYLFYLKRECEIDDNPRIVNYVHVPNGKWAIINTKIINKNSESFILLNYPGPEYKINLKIIDSKTLEANDIGYYHDKFDKIQSIEILNNSKNIEKIYLELDVVSVDKSQNKKIVKKLNIENFINERIEIKLDILSENLNLDEKKLYFIIKNKNIAKIEDLKINLILKNKYLLTNFQIIDKIANCYYIR